MRTISKFKGAYYFLSNFYSAPVVYRGLRFENNEAAFQAVKCPERMDEFCHLNPSEAKKLGRKVKLRDDWEQIKDIVMYEVCKAKFLQNPDLADKLAATGDAELIEGNTWGDRIWGVCGGVGENRLGKILMGIRLEIQANMETDWHINNDNFFAPIANVVARYLEESSMRVAEMTYAVDKALSNKRTF